METASNSMDLLEVEIRRAVERFGETTNSHGASELTGLSAATLATRRSDTKRGEHPPFVRIGKSIRFRTADLVRWVFDRRVEI